MLKTEASGDQALQKQRIRARYNANVDKDKMFVIPASEQPINIYEDDQVRRVAVYVRVSTDSVQQTSSYELQKKYYTGFVENHPSWQLVHIYADEGISGTSLNHRDKFNHMIEDCERGQIDLIVTKSVSRFARNIVDCISIVRKLRAIRPAVGVYFEAEHIFTLKNDTDMSLAFTATMAEEESHTKSTIMNMSVQMRFGLGNFLTPRLIGYTHDDGGNLIINENEAPIVRLIFFMYLYGYTCQEIADKLTSLAVPTRHGKAKWSSGTITEILRNERHCGDIRAGKTYTPDFHSHRSVKNTGQRPIYGMLDHHDPIISRSDFIIVQQQLNNAKYGAKGILPELHVIMNGLLAGFVTVNYRWAAFSADDYYEASSRVTGNVEDETLDVASNSTGEHDYRGYQVVRTQFFQVANRLSCTFAIDGFTFTCGCLRKLQQTNMIEMLIHPYRKTIAICGTTNENRHAMKWTRVNAKGAIQPRKIRCTACMKALFDVFNWKIDCKYRVFGTAYERHGESVIFFQCTEAEALLPPQCDYSAIPENWHITPFVSSSNRRTIAFPESWQESFGRDCYSHKQKFTQFREPDVPWKLSEATIALSSTGIAEMKSRDVLESNIQEIISSIGQGEQANGE